jgi:hypothetical protein
MHGFILTELERFTSTALGAPAWHEILRDAGLGDREYVPVSSYPDHELRDIVVAAARRTGVGVDRVLFDFGRFLAPDLVRNYRHLLHPEWRTLDVVEHTELLIHRIVTPSDPHASVPHLAVVRDENGVAIAYRSRLGLCALARGAVVGLADCFHEHVSVREPLCVQHGALECTIHVRDLRSTDQQIPAI